MPEPTVDANTVPWSRPQPQRMKHGSHQEGKILKSSALWQVWRSIALLAGIALLLLPAQRSIAAQYTLCALRSGDVGPCTCRGPDDAPGQFSVAPRRLCRTKADSPKTRRAIEVPELPERAARAVTQNAERQDAPKADATVEVAPASNEPAPTSSTLESVRSRGRIRCGVNTGLLGFSAQSGAGVWEGIDADFCRAIAVAVLGHPESVEFVPLETPERFEALLEGKVDLLSRNTTWTMNRVVELNVEFAGVAYFDGQGFLTRQERGLVSAQQLDGLSICVQSGTTTQSNLEFYLKAHDLKSSLQVFDEKPALIEAYTSGKCDAYTADRSALYSDRAGFANPQDHEILPETISKEPLGPVVRQDDRPWIEIVRWSLAGLINAEEVGLTRELAAGPVELSGDALRLVEGAGQSGAKLGLHESWLRDVVASVGNYGEMFDGNLGSRTPLGMDRGMNSLWKRGGLLYAPPMW